jgi:L-alanine-DL-glutamate epimerase-like enolase superfamily enzyme
MDTLHDNNGGVTRRTFLQGAASLTAIGLSLPTGSMGINQTAPKRIEVTATDFNYEREPLTPYRFKGSAITELWQTVAYLRSSNGLHAVGLGVQSPLWSDASVFSAHSVTGGNILMSAMTEFALQKIKNHSFTHPIALLESLLPEVHEYGKKITGNTDLRKTFALNALVCVDNAAWLLFAAENKISNFDDLIPAQYKPGLSFRHAQVASMPSFSAGTDVNKIKDAADAGYFIMKLKTGAAGTQKEMLDKDIAFLTAVHKAIGHYETPHTKSGKIPYYFDANERYAEKQTLERFLDHAKKIGAFDQIAAVEEPLGEHNDAYVGDLGVTIAADESAHTEADAAKRIEQGYGAIAVKAIAKTLSMTMKITQLAQEKGIPCFCADLTVNPILVDWNKNVAARLAPFPGINIGIQETNGHQYYKNWETLLTYHPMSNAAWVRTRKGVYETDASFFSESGGILKPSPHYERMFEGS